MPLQKDTDPELQRVFMERCLHLAARAEGFTSPNPMVGCVIVHEGKIVAEGFHRCAGMPHAEVEAVNRLPESINPSDCEVYVSLEPCSHFGKTPPCANMLLAKGFGRVVLAHSDPDPRVSGRGIELLKSSGVEVVSDILASEARFINRRFIISKTHQRPYIVLKWAESADGFMDIDRTGGEQGVHWISHPSTKKLVHLWRSREDAILVGGNTIRTDNPELTVREVAGKSPRRYVFSSAIEFGPYRVFQGIEPACLCSTQAKGSRAIEEISARLHNDGMQSVLVEGGKRTLESFMEAGYWDEIRILRSPSVIGLGLKAPSLPGAARSESFYFGIDRVSIYYREAWI
jgi:diaminohydroxyphosphoribosylaminopyrimidine deaminase/5-amino-6-(5-phosphoribosylamino)uracil reductase